MMIVISSLIMALVFDILMLIDDHHRIVILCIMIFR